MSASSADQLSTRSKLDRTRKEQVLTDVLKQFGSGQKVDPADWQDFVLAQNDELKTGPNVGEPVPSFELADQDGKNWALKDLLGPAGLLLVFTRSADW